MVLFTHDVKISKEAITLTLSVNLARKLPTPSRIS